MKAMALAVLLISGTMALEYIGLEDGSLYAIFGYFVGVVHVYLAKNDHA